MKKILISLCLVINFQSSLATAPWLQSFEHAQKKQQLNAKWQADGGQIHFRFNHDLLKDWGIQVNSTSKQTKVIKGLEHQTHHIRNTSALTLQAPFGVLEGVPEGTLQLVGGLEWNTLQKQMIHNNLRIVTTTKHLNVGEMISLLVVSEDNTPLFVLDNIHTELDKKNNQFHARRMDIRVTKEFAKLLGEPLLTGLVIGEAHMENNLTIPPEYASIKGVPTCPNDRPLWPDSKNTADVALINMTWQQVRNLGNGNFVFAPNATLKNVGEADVAWYGKFTGNYDPYNNSQHPFLFWSAYREVDGRFEQIGLSGIKHAFYTLNTNCTYNCGNNHILYKGCEDVYSVSNNDGGSYLGPKEELEAFTGIWEEVGSFFDQDGNGIQDNISNNTDENRLIVHDSDIIDSNNDFYFSAWYLIRDDINIFNTMGHRSYDLISNQQGTAWSFNNPGTLFPGPASDAYVTPNTTAQDLMSASYRSLQPQEGHLTVAVKVIELEDGLYRYNYMVENHDYDPQVSEIEVTLPAFASYADFVWSDIDHDENNDWQVIRQEDKLILSSINGNYIDWGMLFSFSFTTNVPPEIGTLTLQGEENGGTTFSVQTVHPKVNDLIFKDSFDAIVL